MDFFNEYFVNVDRKENSNKASRETLITYNDGNNVKIDTDNLAKIILSWLIGGLVSLMPTFIYIWSNSQWTKLLQLFFSNKDLFLVITTLTAGAMFEVCCSQKKGIVVYTSVAIGVILMVFSLLIFSLLLFKDGMSDQLDILSYIGAILLGICFFYSIVSYITICWRGR